jgi:hypothetical protein
MKNLNETSKLTASQGCTDTVTGNEIEYIASLGYST